jgi:bifunctional non-homologous end joining protein LigD
MKTLLNSSLRPMLAFSGNEDLIDAKGYLYEPKLDGYRVLCIKDGDKITLLSRRGNDVTGDYPEIQKSVSLIKAKSCVLDGELIIYNDEGIPEFQLLQRRSRSSDYEAVLVVFDILSVNGRDVTSVPLNQRKKILDLSVTDNTDSSIQKIFYTLDGRSLWQSIYKSGLEGIVAKKKDSEYVMGARSRNWIKIKFLDTVDCIIVGYLSKKKYLSSLLLAVLDNSKHLVYIGRVGTGFTIKEEHDIRNLLSKQAVKKIPAMKNFNNHTFSKTDLKKIVWLKPKAVCEVNFLELTGDGLLRASSFLRMRTDKPSSACTWQQFEKIT